MHVGDAVGVAVAGAVGVAVAGAVGVGRPVELTDGADDGDTARRDGSHEQAWHCMPFTEGAQYGIEIFYPYENELHVSKRKGEFVFGGDFGPPTCNGRRSVASAMNITRTNFCSI